MDRKLLEISCNFKQCGTNNSHNLSSNCSAITNDLNNNTNSIEKSDLIDSKDKLALKQSVSFKRKSHPGVKESEHEPEDSSKRKSECNKSDEENSFDAPSCKKAKLSSEAIKHEVAGAKPLVNIDSNTNQSDTTNFGAVSNENDPSDANKLCVPGTPIQLKGIIWNETNRGISNFLALFCELFLICLPFRSSCAERHVERQNFHGRSIRFEQSGMGLAKVIARLLSQKKRVNFK